MSLIGFFLFQDLISGLTHQRKLLLLYFMLSVMEYEIESRKGERVDNFFGHHHENISDGVHTCLYGDVVEIIEDGSWKYAVKEKEFTL